MKNSRRFDHRLKDFNLLKPESKKDYNEKLFSPVSQVYEKITKRLSFGRDRAWKKYLIESLPFCEKPEILDLACGPGDLSFLTACRFSDGKVRGIDLNSEMLKKAEENLNVRFPEYKERIQFTKGDMTKLNVADSSVNIVTGGYALRNAPDLEKTLYEIKRVLTARGTGAFLDFSKSAYGLIQKIQIFLLSFWGRLWGRVYHKNPEVYGYIAESLKVFPHNKAFCELLSKTGFDVIVNKPLFFGFLRLVVVQKKG